MAATLLPVPSTGVSDWTGYITLVDASRRGYMAVTYTNFAASTESAIAAGSIIEIAGAIYQFTATAIDYTGGGSAASDLYIYVKPDAAVSTASVVAWGSAPVWVDAKQGFYASAASITRTVGGMYVGSVATYYNKFLYQGDHIQYCRQNDVTRPLLKKVLNIGEWNMDTTVSVNIDLNLGSAFKKIRNIIAIIRDDSDILYSSLASVYLASAGTIAGGLQSWGVAYITLARMSSGTFDNSSFDGTASTVANRGWVYIEYEA